MGEKQNRDYAIIAVAMRGTHFRHSVGAKRRGIFVVEPVKCLTIRILTTYCVIQRHDGIEGVNDESGVDSRISSALCAGIMGRGGKMLRLFSRVWRRRGKNGALAFGG